MWTPELRCAQRDWLLKPTPQAQEEVCITRPVIGWTSDLRVVLDVCVDHGLYRFLQGGVFGVGSCCLRRGVNFRTYMMYGHGCDKFRKMVCGLFRKMAAANPTHLVLTRWMIYVHVCWSSPVLTTHGRVRSDHTHAHTTTWCAHASAHVHALT